MVAKFTSRVAPVFLTASAGAVNMSAVSLDVSGASNAPAMRRSVSAAFPVQKVDGRTSSRRDQQIADIIDGCDVAVVNQCG
jgi:hypothetical protein